MQRILWRLLPPVVLASALVWGCSKNSDNATPAPTTCNYTLSITSQTFTSGGGSGTSNLTRTSGSCGWTATSDSSFVTVVTGSGSDSATLSFSVANNASTDSRTARITVSWNGGSSQITVTQSGAPAPAPPPPTPAPVVPCTYSLNPSAVVFPGAGGTGQSTITVTGTNCSWTATSNQFWITINSGFTGTSTGTITFTVAANAGAQRFGRIIIATTVGNIDLSFTQDSLPNAAVLVVSPNPRECDLQRNPDSPNTDPARNMNRLECTFDASGSVAVSGISLYEFWFGGTPGGVDSFLLASTASPTITFPPIGCGYSGGGDITVNVYVIVRPNVGDAIVSPAVPLIVHKNGQC